MPRGKRRNIVVATDSQPQFELGYRENKKGERKEGEDRIGGEGQREDRARAWKRAREGQKSNHKQTQILM